MASETGTRTTSANPSRPQPLAEDLGFIVHPTWKVRGNASEIHLYGRLRTGETFLIIESRERPHFYLRASEAPTAAALLSQARATLSPSTHRTLDGEETLCVSANAPRELGPLRRRLVKESVRTYEADVPFAWAYLIDRGLRGTVAIRGSWTKGSGVDRVYANPEISPWNGEPVLTCAALAIDRDPHTGEILCAALAGEGEKTRSLIEHGLDIPGRRGASDVRQIHPDERSLLHAFRQSLCQLDPDLLVGWGIVPEVLVFLKERFAAHKIPFNLGRSDRLSKVVLQKPRSAGWWRGRAQAIIEGRQILDALSIVWSGQRRFEDLELATVSRKVLGKSPSTPGEEASAVLEILQADDLIRLTVRRSLLIGVPLQRAWTSVQAFDFLYLTELHARGAVAPTRDVDRLGGAPAPGGLILEPCAGTARNILVLDFKSLYPSVIRTFNIDPATQVPDPVDREDLLHAPNGAAFVRRPGILPQILDRFFESRDQAKARGDAVASYAYKIIMNSFYGVLGTSSCRFGSQSLAGAITSFGQHLLRWTRDLLQAEGMTIIYGDTDSLFVDAGLPAQTPQADAMELGQAIATRVNRQLSDYLSSEFGVESRLELEMEKVYARFFLPTVRGEERGRAKGYAGLITSPDGDTVEVVGMEAVRRDWTALARRFQRELLGLAFHDAPLSKIEAHVLQTLRELRMGRLDGELVYQKSLRKPIEEYTKAQPPHVQAAALLTEKKVPGETIRYVITLRGPRPIEQIDAELDYAHIIQKQLLPIARSLAPLLELDESLFGSGQMALF